MFSINKKANIIRASLVCSVLLLIVATALPLTTYAQVAVVDSGVNANTSNIAQISSTISSYLRELRDKEYNLDPRANTIKNQQAMQHIANTKAFIASGNDGQSFFPKNLEVLRAENMVAVAENYFTELEEQSTMCSAFKSQVIAAAKQRFVLDNARNAAAKSTCALEESESVEAYMAGQWDRATFHKMNIGDPENSAPLPMLWQAETELQEQVREQQEIEETYLGWGNGFFNQYEVAQANGGPVMVCSNPRQRYSTEVNGVRTHECRVATPSSIMRERAAGILQIENVLKTSGDEHQETEAQVVDAIIRPTMSGGITGRAQSPLPTGIVPSPGTTTNPTPTVPCSGTDHNPYCAFPQVPADPTNATTQQFLAQVANLIQSTSGSSSIPIRQYLVRTMTSLQYSLQTIAMVNDIETEVEEATTEHAGCYSLTLPNNLLNNRTVATGGLALKLEAVKALTDMFLRYQQARATGQPTTQIESQFAQFLQTAWSAPDEADLQAIADEFNNNVELEFTPFQTEHNNRVAACAAT